MHLVAGLGVGGRKAQHFVGGQAGAGAAQGHPRRGVAA
jgi:hypothetical protein